MPSRNGEPTRDPRERFSLYRLCDCTTCEGAGKVGDGEWIPAVKAPYERCPDCRGEGRVRQEVATAGTPEAVGVALVTLAREGEWDECPFGLLDREPECERCGGSGRWLRPRHEYLQTCANCNGSGVKSTGTWLLLPWTPSARNVRDAARTLGKEGARKRADRTE